MTSIIRLGKRGVEARSGFGTSPVPHLRILHAGTGVPPALLRISRLHSHYCRSSTSSKAARMSAESKKRDMEYAAKRGSLKTEGITNKRGLEQFHDQGQEQSSFHAGRQLGVAVISERNISKSQTQVEGTSMNQTEIQGPAPQTRKSASPWNEETTLAVPPPDKPESSRRKMGRLADENAQLKNEKDAIHAALDKMLSDLISTQNELEKTKGKMAGKETELLVWRQTAENFSTELDEKRHQCTKMEEMFSEREKEATEKKNVEVLELEQKVSRLSAELKGIVATPKNETEVLDLQQKVGELTAQLEMKEDQLRKKEDAFLLQESGWAAKLQDTRERLEAKHSEQHRSTQREIAEHQMHRKEAEALLQELQAKQRSVAQEDEVQRLADSKHAALLSQVEEEKSRADQYLQELRQLRASQNNSTEKDSQALDQLRTSHAAEVERLHRLSNFFKNNSERLSRQIRDTEAANRNLHESVQVKEREIEDHTALIRSLRVQIADLQNRSY